MFGYKFIKESELQGLKSSLESANLEVTEKRMFVADLLAKNEDLVKKNKVLETMVKTLKTTVESLESTAVMEKVEETAKPKSRRRKVTKKTKTDE